MWDFSSFALVNSLVLVSFSNCLDEIDWISLESCFKRDFKDFTSLLRDFEEWEDVTKALCIEMFYFKKDEES